MMVPRDEKITAIFKAYRDDLPGRMQELTTAWEKLRLAWDVDCAGDLDRFSHSIAGSAATFDLPEVGDAARLIENDIKSLLSGELEFNAVIINDIGMKMNGLRGIINKLA